MLLLISIFIIAIAASLAFALRQLFRDRSGNMVRFLALRVALSIALFVLLIAAWWLGLIEPHGLAPPG